MASTTTQPTASTTATLPPGPRRLPLLGNILEFRRDQLGFLESLQRTYGNMATVYIGNTPVVMLFRPEHVRYVLTENPRNFTNREAGEGLRQLIGDGLITIDGEEHRQQRRIVQPAFHRKRVESYAGVMVQYTEELLREWHAGQTVNISQGMQELTLRIVSKCLFDIDLKELTDTLGSAFSDMIANPIGLAEGFLNLRIDTPFTAYGRRMAAKRKVDAFIYDLIARRRAEKRDVGDMLSMLLEAQDEDALSDTQLRDHIMTFIAAGHETTANALTWTFYLLSAHPEVRTKLLHELETVLAGRAPTLADIPNLPYTEWVLNESMRVYPPAWVQGRRATEEFELDGVRLPAGTMLMFSQWVMHHLPEVWGDPEVFRPERWDPAAAQKIVPWSYFPFGGGPRICIGMPFAQLEAKLLLATILQRYVPQTVPGYKAELNPLITLRPKHDLRVTLLPANAREDGAGNGEEWGKFVVPTGEQNRGVERRGCLGVFANLLGLLRK